MTLIMRRLTWKRFKDAMVGTLRITAMISLIVMGAFLFTNTMALTKLAPWLGDVVLGWGLPPITLMFTISVVFIVLGCFLDVFALMVLFMPLFFPIVMEIGFDPIWYGTVTVLLIEVATVTPPIALHLYIAQSLDPEATIMHVIRGVLPFYASSIILLVLLVFFPQIALFLPSTM